MRIVAPLAYSLRYIPKNGSKERVEAFVELVDWEIPEFLIEEANLAIEARIPIVRNDGSVKWIPRRWRLLEGGLIRSMSSFSGNEMRAEHLPHRKKDGRIRSNFNFEFLEALGLKNSTEHYNLAQDAIMGRDSFERQRRKMPPPENIISSDREEALELTQRILGRLVIIDGFVWKRTREPLIKLSISNLEMRSEIDFCEDDETRYPPPPRDPSWSMHLPFCDQGRIAEIEGDKQLPSVPQVAIDSISDDAPITRDVNLWHARRAAGYLLSNAESGIGNEERQTLENWMELRDLSRDNDASTAELTGAINALKQSLSNAYREVQTETDWLLRFTDPGEQPQTQVGGATLRR